MTAHNVTQSHAFKRQLLLRNDIVTQNASKIIYILTIYSKLVQNWILIYLNKIFKYEIEMNPSISCRMYKMRAKPMISMSISCKYHSLINNSNNNKPIVKSVNNFIISCNSMSCRHLFRFPIKPPIPSNPFSSKVKKYSERRVLGLVSILIIFDNKI
jgi:hypothetical protein